MPSLTLKGIPDALHEWLRDAAEGNRRSLNGEVIHRLERSMLEETTPGSMVRDRAISPYAPGRNPLQMDPKRLELGEFIELPEEDLYRLELAAGRVVYEPAPGFRHGRIAARINRILWEAGQQPGHGEVFFDMGFLLTEDPPTVRVPDVAFVSATRLAASLTDEVFLATAPDLAVEVLSPSNSASEIQRKALEYLDAGASLVWVVDPATETVAVYQGRAEIRVLGRDDVLDGTAAMPGLEVPVPDLFDSQGRTRS